MYRESAEPVLDLLSDLYSEEDRVFSVGNSRFSSCPSLYRLLTT